MPFAFTSESVFAFAGIRTYVELGDVEQGPASLRVGRQDLNFGSGRLLGTSYWRNASRGYDAALATLRWDRFRLSAFSASQVAAKENGLSHHQQGNNIHGLYGGIQDWIPGSVIEPYLLWRVGRGNRVQDSKTLGVRWAGKASPALDYDIEAASQAGRISSRTEHSWAAAAIAGYTFTETAGKPRVFVEYNFASGGFDQLFPKAHDHHGTADQIAWQNLK
ncbi:MAG: alginate export family protein, partial [Terriglobia bacterium]